MQTCFVPGEVVGTLIGAFELTDPTDCLVKCEASDGCTWFTHHTREQFCALYSEMQEINVQRCPSCVSGKNGSFHIQGPAKRWSPGCVNAAGKARQKW